MHRIVRSNRIIKKTSRFLRRSSNSKPKKTLRGKRFGMFRREDEKGRAKVEMRYDCGGGEGGGGHLRAAAARFVEGIKGRGRAWKSRGRPRRGGGLRHSTFVQVHSP